MAWMWLVFAGLCEVAWAVGLKVSDGFTRLGPSVWTVVTTVLSIVLLAKAARTLPIGTAYAVWTGIGAAGVAVVGMAVLGEPRSLARVACLGLIVAGILGLRILSPAE
ncbi:MAG: DMT family transporter [Acidobacteriota bacterium]